MSLKRFYVLVLQKLELGSAISMRLVKLTGKYCQSVHPKHLIKTEIWYQKYLKKTDLVLDLGCGIGRDAIIASKLVKSIVGIDINKNSLNMAKKLATSKKIRNMKFYIVDANKKQPFKNDYFHKVVCTDVLEHLHKRTFALTEIRRVLKKRGLLFLVTDNPNTTWKQFQKSQGQFYYADKDHKYEYPKKEILKLLKLNKFHTLSINTVTYDTPFKGLIDITGGISLTVYKKLKQWRENMVIKHPKDTTGYRIVAQNFK